jgi:hypothetical protein
MVSGLIGALFDEHLHPPLMMLAKRGTNSIHSLLTSVQSAQCIIFGNYSPINRAAIVFMISLVPAKIRVTRMSRQARAIGYSSQ